MKKLLASKLLSVLGVVAIIVGVNLTYDMYRGTGLSRVPEIGTGRLEAAAYADEQNHVSSDRAAGSAPVAAATTPSLREPTPAVAVIEDDLMLYPTIGKGMRTPFDLWRYYGRGETSFTAPVLPMRFEQWLAFHRKQKPRLMQDVKEYMNSRFDFSGKPLPGAFMSGGKPNMHGPVAAASVADDMVQSHGPSNHGEAVQGCCLFRLPCERAYERSVRAGARFAAEHRSLAHRHAHHAGQL